MDVKGAFNSIQRAHLIRKLKELQSPAMPYIAGQLRHSVIGVTSGSDGKREIVWSAEGVPQGSPLSPALFCLGVDNALKSVASSLPAKVLVLAYADDVFLVGATDDVLTAMDRLERELSKVSLRLNPEKTSYYSRSKGTCDSVERKLSRKEINGELERDGIVVAGVPIAKDPKFTSDFLQKRILLTAERILACLELPIRPAYGCYQACVKSLWQHIWRSGATLGMSRDTTGQVVAKLEQLSQIFMDYLVQFATQSLRATPMSKAIADVACSLETAEGGLGIGLVPRPSQQYAITLGAWMDVMPGLHQLVLGGQLPFIRTSSPEPLHWDTNPNAMDHLLDMHRGNPVAVIDALMFKVFTLWRTPITDILETPLDNRYSICRRHLVDFTTLPTIIGKVWDEEAHRRDEQSSDWESYSKTFSLTWKDTRIPD